MRIEVFTVIASDPGLNPGEAIQEPHFLDTESLPVDCFVATLLAMPALAGPARHVAHVGR